MKDLFKGAFVAMLFQVASMIAIITFSVLLALTLGPELAGVYFLGMMFILVGQVAGSLGLDNAVIGFVAETKVEDNNSHADSIWRQSMLKTIGFSSVLAMLVYYYRGFLARVLNAPQLEEVMIWFALGIPLASLLLVSSSALQGLKKVALAVAFPGVVKSVISIALLLMVFNAGSVSDAILSVIWSIAIALVCSIIAWKASVASRESIKRFDYCVLMRTALPLVCLSLMMLVVRWTDTLMLIFFATTSDVSLYNLRYA